MHQVKTLRLLFYFLIAAATVSACKENSKKPKAEYHQATILNFPEPTGYVTDQVSLYSPAENDSLEKIIGSFEKKTTAQVALITFPPSMMAKDSLEALTDAIGNAWGVGQKDKDNGLVIGICPELHKMTIRNGYGIEKIMSDQETKEIIDKYFVPQFKEAKYFEGTVTGLQRLIDVLTEKLKTQKEGGK